MKKVQIIPLKTEIFQVNAKQEQVIGKPLLGKPSDPLEYYRHSPLLGIRLLLYERKRVNPKALKDTVEEYCTLVERLANEVKWPNGADVEIAELRSVQKTYGAESMEHALRAQIEIEKKFLVAFIGLVGEHVGAVYPNSNSFRQALNGREWSNRNLAILAFDLAMKKFDVTLGIAKVANQLYLATEYWVLDMSIGKIYTRREFETYAKGGFEKGLDLKPSRDIEGLLDMICKPAIPGWKEQY